MMRASFLSILVSVIFIYSIPVLSDDFAYAPPPLELVNDKAVPIDIETSSVTWNVQADGLTVDAQSVVVFRTKDQGYPFLLMNPTSEVVVDGTATPIKRLSSAPFSSSSFFIFQRELEPGRHEMTVKYKYKSNPMLAVFLPINFNGHSLAEAGFPANLQYDHFKLTLHIKLDPSLKKSIYTNGELIETRNGTSTYEFPSYYTSMTFFIDMIDSPAEQKSTSQLTSIDGRIIDVTVYSLPIAQDSQLITPFLQSIAETLPKLEAIYGPYPHTKILLKATSKNYIGAFAGAMVLSREYVPQLMHEIGHSWFMQDIGPASGRDMWIFEGLGTWAPDFKPGPEKVELIKKAIDVKANPYAVSHTFNAHFTGAAILAAFDQRIRSLNKGTLVSYLKPIYNEKKNQTITTHESIELLEKKSGVSLNDLALFYFRQY